MIDKLKFVLSNQNNRIDVVNSVLNTKIVNELPINVILSRIDSINKFTKNSEFKFFLANFKRINNILRSEKSSNYAVLQVNTTIFDTIEEQNIYKLTNAFSKEIIKKGVCEKSQEALINFLIKMNSPISLFFENVIVNHDDHNIKTNRLNLLKNLHKFMLEFSIFEFIEN